jgi:hypothetical protein
MSWSEKMGEAGQNFKTNEGRDFEQLEAGNGKKMIENRNKYQDKAFMEGQYRRRRMDSKNDKPLQFETPLGLFSKGIARPSPKGLR